MSTCIVGCRRKAVSTLCACEKEAEAVDLSVVTLAAQVLKPARSEQPQLRLVIQLRRLRISSLAAGLDTTF